MSGMFGPSLNAIPAAIGAAFMDVLDVFEFTAINYATGIIISAASPNLPAGLPRDLVVSSIGAAGEVAKLILFQSNQTTVPPPPPS